MTLMLELTQEEEKQLRERAAQQGQDASAYALAIVRRGMYAETPAIMQKRSIMELHGLGAEIWKGENGETIDAQEYINELRQEWDSSLP